MRQLFLEADTDRDGVVSREEWRQVAPTAHICMYSMQSSAINPNRHIIHKKKIPCLLFYALVSVSSCIWYI